MADPKVRQARGVFTGTAGSTAFTAGDLVYFDGTDWELADADDNTKFAEAVSTVTVAAGEAVALCRSCVVIDTDAPFTQGDELYLSTTAGGMTGTRPTGNNNLMQVIGFALSTSEIYVDLKPMHEVTVNVHFTTDGTAAFSHSGDWAGVLAAAANEAAGGSFMVPQNCVGVNIAYLWWVGVGTALDGSDTYTIDVSAGVDDETKTATQDGITAAALTVAAEDIAVADVSLAFTGTGIIEPGNVVGIVVDKAAEGAGGDDPLMLCVSIVLQVV
jgi:hypothetical protein